jgi:hypothetical protein
MYFTAIPAMPMVAVALAPSLTGGRTFGLWMGGTVASGVGLVAYAAWAAALASATRRAMTRQAAAAKVAATAKEATP